MSSISSTLRPIRNGLRYFSTAVCTDQGALGEGGAAEAVQARLARQDLDDHQPDAIGRGEDRLDVGDLQRRQPLEARRPLLGLKPRRQAPGAARLRPPRACHPRFVAVRPVASSCASAAESMQRGAGRSTQLDRA